MKRNRFSACGIAFFLLVLAALPGRASEVPEVTWPSAWMVFLPVDPDAPALPLDVLSRMPETIEVGPETIRGRRVEPTSLSGIHGLDIDLPRVKVDLAPLFGEVARGNTAWVFLPIEASEAGSGQLGLGADWWMTAWLNGEEIVDTTVFGNASWPPQPDDHRVTVDLRAGLNVLAVRFVSGAGSSQLAISGPAHLAEIDRLLAEHRPDPGKEQAYWSAAQDIDLSPTDVDLTRGEIAGVTALPARPLLYDGDRVQDATVPRFDEPVRLLLSKSVYPAEDLHLDAVVWLTPEDEDAEPEGRLELVLRDESGEVLAREKITDLSPTGQFFSMGFSPAIIGRGAELEVRWISGDGEAGSALGRFRVAEPADVARSGRIALRVPNDSGATLRNAPFTVGVPFPRGALEDEAHVRLVDAQGREIPVQTRVSARWSRFGPIKWLLCDFTADLAGGPRELFLEYGAEKERGSPRPRGWFAGCRRQSAPEPARQPVSEPARLPPIRVETAEGGFPTIEAGRLRASEEGLFYDLAGDGTYTKFLAGAALRGEFIEHEDGRRFTVAADAVHEIEEQGSEKVVVRRTGWYREEGGKGEFCNFVTRLVFHRDSPVVRIYHTWIFTGDGNRDRIANMGWHFPLAAGLDDRRFLSAFGEEGTWSGAERLVQWNYEGYDLHADGGAREVSDGRSPGVAVAGDGARRLYFGAKDFWQNFPSEIGFEGDTFGFYNWPRHNRPASFERPVQPGHAYRHRFAHEGKVLDFRLPDEYAEEAIWRASSRGRSGHYSLGRPESANAQGIARTEEMFLYLAGSDVEPEQGARVMQGLNDETLRAVVDPVWIAASGVFGGIHHRDTETYAEEERIYEEICRSPARWADRLGIYGKWIFGDIAAWEMNLYERTSDAYRAYRKNHHGWPFRWIAFARGGQPEMLRNAQRATRQMVDANYSHYSTQDVDDSTGPEWGRGQGWWHRGILPWAGKGGPNNRFYTVDCDYLWHDYYITGFRRPRDVALLFGEATRHETRAIRTVDRASQSMFLSYLHMYEATFDPWFLVALHAFADLYLDKSAPGFTLGDFHRDRWKPTGWSFYEFSGSPEFLALYREFYDPPHPGTLSYPRTPVGGTNTDRIPPNYFGWRATGLEHYLKRLSHDLDWAGAAAYEGEPHYLRGIYAGKGITGTSPGLYAGWYIHQFPLALGAFEAAGYRPEPLPVVFEQFPATSRRVEQDGQTVFAFRQPDVLIQKEEGRAVSLMMRGSRRSESLSYSVVGPDGREVVSGTATLPGVRTEEIPADAPPGIYRLHWEGTRRQTMRGALHLYVADGDVPEVFVLDADAEGTRVGAAGDKAQYWFLVPEGVEGFQVDVSLVSGQARRFTVWTPEMERAWDFNYFEPAYDGPRPMRAQIAVPPGQSGRLWRITAPGHGGFILDPVIPPVFSVSREKWFDPGRRDGEIARGPARAPGVLR